MPRQSATVGDSVAAVDLGSNSFHMLVAREEGGQLQIVDRLRDAVRLAAGLDDERHLSAEAQARALACLTRFGQRLRGIPTHRVRVVGTNTLRRMKDGAAFITAAETALGHHIEIIAGVEEARLVYSGVTHGMGRAQARRLVVDIGGGSTELIIGERNEPQLMESVSLGCVVHTQRFFSDGVITRAHFRQARLAARVELEFLERRYRDAGWDLAIGASGTIRGAWRVMVAQGWAETEITRQALEKTVNLVVQAGAIGKINFDGLREDRRPVFAGGLAVLAGVFDALEIDRMATSEYALREGLIYDLLGRLENRDVRAEAVAALARRYGVEAAHARAVERTTLKALEQTAVAWNLPRVRAATLLGWAATLHEIGLVVAHDNYHKHGEYLLANSDLRGFSFADQSLLAALVRLHRGKFAESAWKPLPGEWQEPIQRLAVLLRLGVLLHRSRAPGIRLPFSLKAGKRSLEIAFPPGWLDKHPLTEADLAQEAEYLLAAGWRLRYR
jgi:exopolyphosphatase / guanosine-5'-triphosphate,3'-diphosphate pyrophosphatase